MGVAAERPTVNLSAEAAQALSAYEHVFGRMMREAAEARALRDSSGGLGVVTVADVFDALGDVVDPERRAASRRWYSVLRALGWGILGAGVAMWASHLSQSVLVPFASATVAIGLVAAGVVVGVVWPALWRTGFSASRAIMTEGLDETLLLRAAAQHGPSGAQE